MSSVLLRRVPGDSPVHRLWAGTKILGVLAISLVLMFLPTWPVLGVVVAFLVLTAVTARVPVGALPRLPWWFWALTVAGGALNFSLGAVAGVRYLQVLVFGFVLLATSMVIAWTTPLNEVAPAIATLGAPLRRLRVPVDEWAVAIALCLRSLPLLIEEIRVLNASRRLRPGGSSHGHSTSDNTLIDIITAAMSVSMRRAGELGEAITARGGTGQLTAYTSRPGRGDLVALLVMTLVCGGAIALGVVLL